MPTSPGALRSGSRRDERHLFQLLIPTVDFDCGIKCCLQRNCHRGHKQWTFHRPKECEVAETIRRDPPTSSHQSHHMQRSSWDKMADARAKREEGTSSPTTGSTGESSNSIARFQVRTDPPTICDGVIGQLHRVRTTSHHV